MIERTGGSRPEAMASAEDGWGVVPLDEGQTKRRRFGPLALHLRRSAGEVWVAHTQVPGDEADPLGGDEENLPWSRWAPRRLVSQVSLTPALPDRLVVVSPEVPFHLESGAEARIYVRIPLWVKVALGDGEASVLLEAPTSVLSDTWWGDPSEGELGYWLPTRARRQISDDLFVEHRAVCALDLENLSDRSLSVERFALRTVHLSLYRDKGRLWGGETRVRYEGHEDGSQIDITEAPPKEAPGAKLIGPPRQPLPRGFRALTFDRLKLIPGL